jgi:hypothetical protein
MRSLWKHATFSFDIGGKVVKERTDVRGGETTARTSEKDLAEGWLEILRVRVIVVIVPRLGSGLELEEGAVGREE